MLRKIFGPIRVVDEYRIQTNRVLYEFFNDMDVAKRVNNQSFCWLGKRSFGWMKMLHRDECLMQWLVVIGGWDDRIRVGKTSLKRLRLGVTN